MKVRSARLDDLDALVALEQVAFPLDPWSANLVGQGIEGSLPTVFWLVAEQDGVVVGHAVVSVVDTDAELQRIATDVARRRSGIATALLEGVIALAARDGADRLLLEVREDNAAARGLYAGHGFAEMGRRPRYYRDGTTAVVLARAVAVDAPSGSTAPTDTMEP